MPGLARETFAADEPQLSRRKLMSSLLRPIDASVRRPRDVALGRRPKALAADSTGNTPAGVLSV